jgi:hypothetical protein
MARGMMHRGHSGQPSFWSNVGSVDVYELVKGASLSWSLVPFIFWAGLISLILHSVSSNWMNLHRYIIISYMTIVLF